MEEKYSEYETEEPILNTNVQELITNCASTIIIKCSRQKTLNYKYSFESNRNTTSWSITQKHDKVKTNDIVIYLNSIDTEYTFYKILKIMRISKRGPTSLSSI